MTAGGAASGAAVTVWDPLVRIGHWTLVISVLGAYLTGEGGAALHEWLGYIALAVLAVRIVWGFVGPRYARFAQFVPGVAATIDYARAVLAHREPRYLGHNPLGGWMVVLLLAAVAAAGGTGWLYTTDAFWGDEMMEEIHEAAGNGLIVLAFVHVAGVLFTSRRHAENLAGAMLTGRKESRAGDVR